MILRSWHSETSVLIATLAVTASKILEKSPLKYPLVQHLASLAPQKLVSTSTDAAAKFEKILQMLVNAHRQSAEDSDELLTQSY